MDFKYFDISYNSLTCKVACSNLVVSDIITIPSHDGTYSVTVDFEETFKMCTKVINDSSSVSGKITMLYFYETDGSGTYSQPNSISATSTVSAGADRIKVVSSGLPYPNSSQSRPNFYPMWGFGITAYNYDTISEANGGDFFWFDFLNPPDTSAITVVNPESVDKNGCYSGQY